MTSSLAVLAKVLSMRIAAAMLVKEPWSGSVKTNLLGFVLKVRGLQRCRLIPGLGTCALVRP